MSSGKTPIQRNCPVPEDFVVLAKRYKPDAINIILGFVWQGFDMLASECFDVCQEDGHIEDEITYAAYCKIQDISAFSPFQVISHPPEREKSATKGSMPESDLGFRLRGGNVRSHFSIEAKVLRTDGDVSKYVKEISDNYLTGRYSTFSSEATMLGYLLQGNPLDTFKAISQSLNCQLETHAAFQTRNHRISSHMRQLCQKTNFICHHMIILFSKN
jgi:hypothetical protein